MNRELRPRLAAILLVSAAVCVATACVPGTAARAVAAERTIAAHADTIDDCDVSVSGNQDTFSTYTARVASDPCNLQIRAYAHCSVYQYPSGIYFVDTEGPTIDREGNSVAQCDQLSVGGGYEVNVDGNWVQHQIS
jgi:hypothetical protein